MASNKAHGPDGYIAEFHKAAWGIIGKDVCKAVQEFMTNGKLLSQVNTTLLLLSRSLML